MSEATAEDWKLAAEAYEKGSRGATQQPTGALLERVNALFPFSEATSILDNGCGTGNVISRLIQDYGSVLGPSTALAAADWAPAMVDQVNAAKQTAVKENPGSLWARVDTHVLDAMDLHAIPGESQSHVTAGWVYHMTKSPQKCLSETHRVLKPNGVLGLVSWGDIQWLSIMSPISQINPSLRPPAGPPEWGSAAGLAQELTKARFRDIEVREVDVALPFQSRALFVDILLAKMPPLVALTKGFDAEQLERLRGLMVEEMARLCPTEPGALKGVAVVAVGRK
ncbi:S-adenosyl-L-methionine-dependent methyltransferase [Chaetomium sp. MPI-CAGE-AT-0009]|nr:S-adenosyl-L-methionine-dependent methyltransferase [Chaetomium sp. MPI-CAGE-AT-0009]